ncbi:hypothetical protein [Robbsia andropogonis]|nr:hypothetical protein [Robbsia andropogonis]MCP1119252.1 hypothetical protein [Robbsia andropogonis]MCP1129092.1 hypothetical protein [Robbsia andropogonis]
MIAGDRTMVLDPVYLSARGEWMAGCGVRLTQRDVLHHDAMSRCQARVDRRPARHRMGQVRTVAGWPLMSKRGDIAASAQTASRVEDLHPRRQAAPMTA